MNNSSYSVLIRNLSKQHYQNHIGFEEYRMQRKIILDKIDAEFNGNKNTEVTNDITAGSVTDSAAGGDGESSEDTSMYMKTVAFFKNKDVDG